jgi:DHA3 family macrolide efflux protein-like MFS transporter
MSTSPAPPAVTQRLGRTFVWICSTQALSIVGSTLSSIGVAVYVYLETGDPRWLGALMGVTAAPFVVMAPLLALLDRRSRRSMLLLGDCLAATGPVLALTLALAGRLELWHLVVAGLLSGIGNAVQAPAASAVVPALVPSGSPETLARANGLFQLGPAAGIVVGPAVATPLVAWFGVEAVLLVDVVTFAIAVAATLLTPFADAVDERPVADDDGSWRAALGWLWSEGRALVVLLVAMGVVNFLLSFFNVSMLAVSTDVGGAALAGVAVALGGVAMIGGSFATGRVGVATRPVRVFAAALSVTALGCGLAALRPWFPLVVVGVVVALAPVSLVNAGVATLFHTRVPVGLHGRVFAVRSTIARSLDPIGAVIAGLVIAEIAAPAMSDGGAGASAFGWVLTTGPERGAALVLLCAGFGLLVVAIVIGTDRRLRPLDRPPAATTSNADLAEAAAGVE